MKDEIIERLIELTINDSIIWRSNDSYYQTLHKNIRYVVYIETGLVRCNGISLRSNIYLRDDISNQIKRIGDKEENKLLTEVLKGLQ